MSIHFRKQTKNYIIGDYGIVWSDGGGRIPEINIDGDIYLKLGRRDDGLYYRKRDLVNYYINEVPGFNLSPVDCIPKKRKKTSMAPLFEDCTKMVFKKGDSVFDTIKSRLPHLEFDSFTIWYKGADYKIDLDTGRETRYLIHAYLVVVCDGKYWAKDIVIREYMTNHVNRILKYDHKIWDTTRTKNFIWSMTKNIHYTVKRNENPF